MLKIVSVKDDGLVKSPIYVVVDLISGKVTRYKSKLGGNSAKLAAKKKALIEISISAFFNSSRKSFLLHLKEHIFKYRDTPL